MITTSNEYREKENRFYHAKLNIHFTDGTEKEVDEHSLFGLTLNDDVSATDVFSIGTAIINMLTLKLDNADGSFDEKEFYGAEINVKIGLELESGIEWLQKGVYIADAGDDISDVITVKAYDYMKKFDQNYEKSTLSFPATLGSIVRDACLVCGVDLTTATFHHDDFVVQTKPEASTFREILSMIGQISCNWCRINRFGQLEISFYDISGYEQDTGNFLEINDYLNGTVSTEDVVITGVKVTDGEDTCLAGEEGYVIAIEENTLIQGSGETVAGWLGEKLIGLSFRKMSVTHEADPSVEAGDLAKIIDRKGNMKKTLLNSITYTFGGTLQSKTCAATPLRNSVERFSKSTKNYVKYRELLDNYKSVFDSAVDALGKRLDGASGLFETTEKQTDGSYKYFLHDKPQLNESTIIMQITSEALAISTDGGKTWPTGITVDGEAIISLLRAKGISASWINTGELIIQDESGKTIFNANKDAGTVLISGNCVRIGDQNLEEALKDTKTLVMQLDSEYATVNVDSEGNYNTFPEITFHPTVYFGAIDVTADCTFTVTASSYVTGKWNGSTGIYTVESLLADSAWVDIRAIYLRNFSVTKRFNVSKLYQGNKGEQGNPGVNATLEASASVIRKEAKGILIPNKITFNSCHLDENEAKKPHNTIFVIEETTDNTTWKEVYRSTTVESEVSHSLYTVLTGNGTALRDPAGYYLATARDILAVRCSIYNSNGDLIDRQTVTVVNDITALTQEQIVDILSNDGLWKGLYYLNGHLYISFDSALGGALTLGGLNNGNGLLKIRDEDGNDIGYIDNTGVHFNQGEFSGTVHAAQIDGSKVTGSTFLTNDGKTATKVEAGTVQFRNVSLDSDSYIEDEDGELIYVGVDEADWTSETDVANAGYMQTNSKYYPDFTNSSVTVEENVAVMELNAFWGLFVKAEKADIASFGKNLVKLYGKTEISGDTNIAGDVEVLSGNGQVHCNTLWTKYLQVDSTKSRMVDTQNYQKQYLHAYETPSPMFGDCGSSSLNDAGEDLIPINDIFLETVNTGIEYQVFLQKEGPGDIWVETKEPQYFSVKGTPDLKYSWEIKALQKDYEHIRFDDVQIVFQDAELERLEKELADIQKKELEEADQLERELLQDMKGWTNEDTENYLDH